MIGALVTIIVATIVSFCMGANDPHKMDEALFAPFIRGIIRKNRVMDKNDSTYVLKEAKPIECKIVQENNVIIIEEYIDLKGVTSSK